MSPRGPTGNRRRLLLGGVLVAAALLIFFQVASARRPIEYYSRIDDESVALHVYAGPRDSCRATDISTSAQAIRVTVRCINWLFFLPQTGDFRDQEVILRLGEAIGDRTIHDGQGPALTTSR
jgi:hypothetical protein